ncbi:uncharacterized protein LOC128269358 isoform X2 [Anopheles cruzii]|uniref:uncharacterized protein LOC128269358 isoform X2 n=1 Tax=Anopheles cruzii TaxID=68878 RepID=UPI0022EC6E30|nr:uncharacterized protein LOC128269358 isoform X2 [Anopheles cruzii]
MYRNQRSFETANSTGSSSGQVAGQDSATNNVTGLISKFEVRNYPINRGGLLRNQVPGAERYGPYQRYAADPVPSQSRSSQSADSRYAYFSDSAESVPQRVATTMNGRPYARSVRPGTTSFYHNNGSLSSLNESDYYEDPFEDTRSPLAGFRRGSDRSLHRNDPFEDEEPPGGGPGVAGSLTRVGAILQMLSRIPFPRMSVTGMGLCSLVAIFFCPRAIGSNILFPGFRLLFGTLYPAYASYKAVRTKNVKEYVKWMMYWIVFAFFTCIETFTDILLSWFPFYYELKVIIVLWLLSPATRGSSTLYRKFVHPMLTRREQEIDDYINQAKEKGYTAVLQLGSKGVNYATNVIMQTAIKHVPNDPLQLIALASLPVADQQESEPDLEQ